MKNALYIVWALAAVLMIGAVAAETIEPGFDVDIDIDDNVGPFGHKSGD